MLAHNILMITSQLTAIVTESQLYHQSATKYKARADSPRDKTSRTIHDAKNSFTESDLPGEMVRAEKDKPVEDKAVNEAFDNVGKVLAFYKEHFDWNSMDNKNMDVVSTVHFGES